MKGCRRRVCHLPLFVFFGKSFLILCLNVLVLFATGIILAMNIDLMKVGWTRPPKSTSWRRPCPVPKILT